ncbi:MAG: ParB/RepB/Spo0J family partition protein [Bdellovibrionota bacterium]
MSSYYSKDDAGGFGGFGAELQKGANIARRKNALGRGLSALMSPTAVAVEVPPQFGGIPQGMPTSEGSALRRPAPHAPVDEAAPSAPSAKEGPLEGGLIYLSIDRVQANKAQPRQTFAQAEIDKLSESIKNSGLLQPIVVRRRAGEMGPLASYEIVAGERRWRAAKQAGLLKIPALLKQLTDKEALELGIIENVQRSDLNPVEEALAYQRLANDYGSSQNEIAQTVGKDRASIANSLRLLKLPTEVQQLLIAGKLSAGHGRALLMLESEGDQKALAEQILREGLSVRQTEHLAGKGPKNGTQTAAGARGAAAEKPLSPSQTALEDRLRRALGTKVKLSVDAGGKGELKISFFSAAELERIVEKLQA